jgi:trigger factor
MPGASTFAPRKPPGAHFTTISLYPMNVQVEPLPNCLATIKVDVPAETVNAARDQIIGSYASQARVPGYRPGKVPRTVIERRFQKEIREELERRLLAENTRAAISEKNLRVLQVQNVEDIEFAPDQSLHFSATLVTAPEFELPDYKKIPVVIPSDEVSDAEVDEAIENLRKQAATFEDITGRGLQMEDFAVIDYTGTTDGKPVSEVFPKAGKPLTANTGFWVKMAPESFLPGFSDALLGAALEETREFDLTVPADFVLQEMAGATIHYSVAVNGLKSQKLPPLDDAFASTIIEGKTFEEVRALAKGELGRQKAGAIETQKRDQIMAYLIGKVECELPQNYVAGEMRRILGDIVQREQSRGASEDAIKEREKELVEAAAEGARQKLKGTFILQRIAEAEKITVTQAELRARVNALAARSGMTPDKAVRELEKRDAMDGVAEDVLSNKVIDYLVGNADVRTAEAGAA